MRKELIGRHLNRCSAMAQQRMLLIEELEIAGEEEKPILEKALKNFPSFLSIKTEFINWVDLLRKWEVSKK